MSKFGRKLRHPPDGFEYIEDTLNILDNELRESKVTFIITIFFILLTIFICDDIEVNEPHEGLRKNESQWPIHQINWQRSRYVYDMYYTYKRISKEVYDYCIENKIIDAALIAKWKKPGYERLCSTYVINPRNYKFGTVSICRVPKQSLAPGTVIEDPMTGCRGCASGSGGEKNIFGNKYGQYLAAIQIAREERDSIRAGDRLPDNRDDEENEDEQYAGPVGAADGSSGKKVNVWAGEDEDVELPESIMGVLSGDAEREGRLAAKNVGRGNDQEYSGPPGKRSRT